VAAARLLALLVVQGLVRVLERARVLAVVPGLVWTPRAEALAEVQEGLVVVMVEAAEGVQAEGVELRPLRLAALLKA
jgi:hypothetical protein